jgi:hypothetical protein
VRAIAMTVSRLDGRTVLVAIARNRHGLVQLPRECAQEYQYTDLIEASSIIRAFI